MKRPIPSTGELLPVIGLGTSGSFEVALGSAQYAQLRTVLERFVAAGASVIDTAPTYGNAEEVLGLLLQEAGARARVFLATKLSRVRGRRAGLAQFRGSLKRLKTERIELLQIHNLDDWKVQLGVARELQHEGKVKYVGVTHYDEARHDVLADVLQQTRPDFVQVNYSVTNRGAERRLFPLARDLGIAVLANRNFNDGALFAQVQGKALPSWAKQIGIDCWAQLLLRFVLSHEAVTSMLPATGKADRIVDHLNAPGPCLTRDQRDELIALVAQ
jgi:aryl-alcohol dehydrogenase-like predicted oxidoreductase